MTDTTRTTAQDVGMPFAGPEGLAEQLLVLRTEVEQLRADVVRLDGDLDESRRLNLRAAELLDIVYQELGARRTPSEDAP
ncbi:hypothetical protein [Arthrobacter sp. B0490]|uniref:hypothetical protein n=1 Tax=Arthrobacter sp. B0490 TaxID=2058891 RepID=UPI000CE45349|nr:hypothetical protein [Arthrobacter sp. B0490]